MWPSGFFNSINGDRLYNSDQMSDIFEGLISDGVYATIGNKLAVQPNTGLTIQIASGRGWFGRRWVNNTSEYLLTLENADVLLNRYCAVCIRVDLTDAGRKAEPYLKYGDFATNPIKPSMERTETVKEYCLAYVLIPAKATAITYSEIEDTRGNSDLCGWVTGLITQVDSSTLWQQWADQLTDFMTYEQSLFLEWFNTIQNYMNDNIEANLTAEIVKLQNRTKKASGVFEPLGWNSQDDGSYLQTITVQGVTADNDIVVSPKSEWKEKYCDMRCEAIEQGGNSVTFRCLYPIDEPIEIEVVILNL